MMAARAYDQSAAVVKMNALAARIIAQARASVAAVPPPLPVIGAEGWQLRNATAALNDPIPHNPCEAARPHSQEDITE